MPANDRDPVAPDPHVPGEVGQSAVDRGRGTGPGTGRLGGTDYLVTVQPSPTGRVMGTLRAEASRITTNWVLRVANLPAFRAVPNLHLTQIQDVMPDILQATLVALATPDPAVDPEPLARVGSLASEHGGRRAASGFPIGVALAEFQELRAELWAAILRAAAEDVALADAPLELQERLNRAIDTAMIQAAEAWAATAAGRGAS